MTDPDDHPWPDVLDDVTSALETLTAALAGDDDFTVLLQGVCDQVVHAVPGVDEVTVTMLRDGSPWTAATTSDTAAGLDRDQYRADDGPCLRAARSGALFRVSAADMADEWPVFIRDAVAAGFNSFLSAPLTIDDEYAGAINCYSSRGHGFADLDEKLLDLYVSATTAALRSHRRYERAHAMTEQLVVALDTRAVIEQAKGILMALRQISAEEAFAVLVEQSQQENAKLNTVATRFVTRASGGAV
ncbi:ANTAR domain-containing protein [Umezawaea endophytica]|uniref:GAF and ANTAR domain-containing protein n=1 Tax=Umezawaea endophytica TaxID=1654476 RepID=A0A9X2VUJ0_9PSEU|nr:GAF and ANTAR domain-containing protein [Umezawaea endophytica]MCS7482975.1 GAF and ANTAR domain-containing protein [Umezawaea endophytica]